MYLYIYIYLSAKLSLSLLLLLVLPVLLLYYIYIYIIYIYIKCIGLGLGLYSIFPGVMFDVFHQASRWRSPHSCSAAPAVPPPSAALPPGDSDRATIQ